MKSKNIIGSRIALFVSDPWEFGTECGSGPFPGIIIDKDGIKVLILLASKISYGGRKFPACICTPRHQGKDIMDILSGEKIAANMMLISTNAAFFSDVNRQTHCKTAAVVGTIEQG
jgi:hypothetical protein